MATKRPPAPPSASHRPTPVGGAHFAQSFDPDSREQRQMAPASHVHPIDHITSVARKNESVEDDGWGTPAKAGFTSWEQDESVHDSMPVTLSSCCGVSMLSIQDEHAGAPAQSNDNSWHLDIAADSDSANLESGGWDAGRKYYHRSREGPKRQPHSRQKAESGWASSNSSGQGPSRSWQRSAMVSESGRSEPT